MKREEALEVARALENLENLEIFIEEIDHLVAKWEDQFTERDFLGKLYDLLEEERKKKEEILEKM